jgi:hypothetical protein
MSRGPRCVAAGLAMTLFAAFPAGAQVLDTDVGPLDLPFAFTEGYSMRESRVDSGIFHHRTQAIRVDSGPMQGTDLMLDTEIMFPQRDDVARLPDMAAAHVANLRAIDGARVQAIDWNGQAFHLIDEPLPAAEMIRATGSAGEPMRSLGIYGVTPDAYVGIGMRLPAGAPEAGAIADAMRGMKRDDAAMAARQARFVALAWQPIADHRLHGAFVDVVAPQDRFVRQASDSASSAVPGRVVARSAGFVVARGSLFSADFDTFFSKCEAGLDADAHRRWRFVTPTEPDRRGAGTPTRLGGIDGTAYEFPARPETADHRAHDAGYQWIGEQGGTGYALTIRRHGDRALTDALIAQLREDTFACRLAPDAVAPRASKRFEGYHPRSGS